MSLLSNFLDALEAIIGKPVVPVVPAPPVDLSPAQEPQAPTIELQPEVVAPKMEEPKTEPTKTEPSPLKPQWNFVSKNLAKLSEADYQNAADLLGVEVACVKAVTSVESSGGGFYASGLPKILFEAHVFARQTAQKYNISNPKISSAKWNKALYAGGEKELNRLKEAMTLDESAALRSASWGLFQILGINHKACGFNSVQEFVTAHVESEAKQLDAFVKFLKANKMDVSLRNKNWQAFAKAYNGPAFKSNSYDTKLEAAYNKFKA